MARACACGAQVSLVAGAGASVRQRFHSGMLSNLSELCRLLLAGFHSYDLSELPSVRPGFVLRIVDLPKSREEPLGAPGVDVLPPPGEERPARRAASLGCRLANAPLSSRFTGAVV